ncbi:glycosidase [Candidatus Woesearchaeota archaeon B3_Woes]|nr:MAG: glycosidase [Candidatus Woesearchaeota archaeon B3_Woes]
MVVKTLKDKIVFGPDYVSIDFCPVAKDTGQETFLLGTFNPGMTRLKNGNVLLMIRMAETLKGFKGKDVVYTPRMDLKKKKFVLDTYPRKHVKFSDPRHFDIKQPNGETAIRLTSVSWLLPVEMSPDGMKVVKIHYTKAILPEKVYQEYGIEDPRITKIKNKYYMTAVGVSPNKICTCMYESSNGLDYKLKGVIFGNQNKDVVLFPEKIKGRYVALTRPEGPSNIAFPYEHGSLVGGEYINISYSPDLKYWTPYDEFLLTLKKDSLFDKKIGNNSPPILMDFNRKKYWFFLFHGVQSGTKGVGVYRTFAALLDKNNPTKIFKIKYKPFLEPNLKLEKRIREILLLKNVVFTTGMIPDGKDYLICSGEADTVVRMTKVSKEAIVKFFS